MSNQLTSFAKGISAAEVNTLIAAYAATLLHATQHEQFGSDDISIENLSGQHSIPLVNGSSAILPVASNWGTPPSSLANATDNDLATVTGTGSKVLGAAGQYGIIDITLPTSELYLVASKVGIWTSAGEARVYVQCKANGSTYTDSGNVMVRTTMASESVIYIEPVIIVGPDLRLIFYGSAAGTFNAKIYEIFAFALQHA